MEKPGDPIGTCNEEDRLRVGMQATLIPLDGWRNSVSSCGSAIQQISRPRSQPFSPNVRGRTPNARLPEATIPEFPVVFGALVLLYLLASMPIARSEFASGGATPSSFILHHEAKRGLTSDTSMPPWRLPDAFRYGFLQGQWLSLRMERGARRQSKTVGSELCSRMAVLEDL